LPQGELSFLLFPVDQPQFFDAVVLDVDGQVREIQVKQADAASNWIWGAFKLSGRTLHALEALWRRRGRTDEFIGTLVNAWIAEGGVATGVRAGSAYLDIGTLRGYRAAMSLLADGAALAEPRRASS
jgi:NDP-sugar pyrophosphorylase family protein